MRLLAVALSLFTVFGCAVAADVAAKEAPVSIHALDLVKLDGSPLKGEALAGKAVLVVNVASKCGFTPQYEGLQKLYDTYKDKGFEIVAQPCNQFMGQEPGSAEDIATFCKMNYGVTFTLLDKGDVNGPNRTPLYDALVDSAVGGGKKIGWNFEKFLVSPTGEVVGRWASQTTPEAPELVQAIEAALPKKS